MHFDGHTHFVTVGHGIGSADCPVPTCGREWITTFPPVVLPQWPVAEFHHNGALTTVANWRSYGPIHHDGVMYGQKAHSFRPLFSLPDQTSERFLLALRIHPDELDDLESFARHNWDLVDPTGVAGSPQAYRRFVRGSKAEIGVAKSGYVVSRCGWFSDRSACYLASGRPVVAQETGFSKWLAPGEGLLAFTNVDDAVEAIEAIRSDYHRHCRAARAIAETHFDSDRVLTRLLGAVGVTA
jgi:hypothetical protein